MRRSALLLLPLALVLTGAKGTKGSKKSSEPAPIEASAAPAESSAAPSSSDEVSRALLESMSVTSKIDILDAGEAPLAPLAYAPTTGSTALIETRNAQTMAMAFMGQNMDMAMPTMVQTMRSTVGERGEDGVFPVRVEQVGVRLEGGDGPMVAGMQEAISGLQDMAFELRIGPDGRIAGMDVLSAGEGQNAEMVSQMMQKMQQSLTPFPLDAVGVGAKWRSTTTLNMAGLAMVVEQTYTLTERSPTHVHVDVVTAMRNDGARMEIPGMPPDATVEFRKFDGTGGGAMDIDLAGIVNTGSLAMKLDLEMAVGGIGAPDDEPIVMSMKMDQLTEMKRVAE